MSDPNNRQRARHSKLLDEVRARASSCLTLLEIAAMHEPSLIVDDGYVLCGQCRSTWPCQTTKTIEAAMDGQS